MKVLMVTHELPSSKNANTIPPVARQIKSLADAGVEIELLEVTGRSKIKYLQALPGLFEKISSVDLIHAHYGFCGMLARMQIRKPLLVSFMGSDLLGTPDDDGKLEWTSRLEILANKMLARMIDGIIVKSEEMARVLSPHKTYVIPNGVDIDMFSPQEMSAARRQLGWPEEEWIVLFPGNPEVPRKGFPFAREAIRLAEEKTGKPILIKTLKQVPHELVPAYMNAANLVMMTSYIEGSPNVVKEAMACNRPVVGVPVGDVADLLRGVKGCRVELRDVNRYSNAVIKALTERDPVEGRLALINKGLDIVSVSNRIIQLYRHLLHSR